MTMGTPRPRRSTEKINRKDRHAFANNSHHRRTIESCKPRSATLRQASMSDRRRTRTMLDEVQRRHRGIKIIAPIIAPTNRVSMRRSGSSFSALALGRRSMEDHRRWMDCSHRIASVGGGFGSGFFGSLTLIRQGPSTARSRIPENERISRLDSRRCAGIPGAIENIALPTRNRKSTRCR